MPLADATPFDAWPPGAILQLRVPGSSSVTDRLGAVNGMGAPSSSMAALVPPLITGLVQGLVSNDTQLPLADPPPLVTWARNQ